MTIITMSAKGQFVLPKAIRENLRLYPGCRINVTVVIADNAQGQSHLLLTPALNEPEALFKDRPPVKRVLSLDDMDKAIGKAVHAGV